MGPVRQNPIQRTVRSVHVCALHCCTIVAHNIAQNRPDNFPSNPPDNHHHSDDVYLREGGTPTSPKRVKIAVRLLQTSKEHTSAYDLVPQNLGTDNLGYLGV